MNYTADEIRTALQKHELVVYYQPQYDSINGQMKKYEKAKQILLGE